MSNPHATHFPPQRIPSMVRCVVRDGDRPPCGALVFARDQEKHLAEMHPALPSKERAKVRKWFVQPENPKPVAFSQMPARSKR